MSANGPTPPPISDVAVHLSAAEAYPALEQAFLDAKSEIWASFLVFDLRTGLRSAAARAVGKTWFDLLVHVLRRGVSVHFVISDVDPIGRPVMHRDATHSLRRFCAAAEIAGYPARLTVAAARHPACTGAGIRLLLWPYIQKKLRAQAHDLNEMPPETRTATLRDMPGLAAHLRVKNNGTLVPRLWSLPPLFPAVHHQKMAVIDRQLLYIGGLDLDESRYDTPHHNRPGHQTWHDLQLMMTGPVVAEAQAHLEQFRAVVRGATAPRPHLHLLTTMSRQRPKNTFRFGPERAVTTINAAHTTLAQTTTQLLYLETQYFRDNRFAKCLARRAKAEPNLTMILILPAAPDDVAFEGNRSVDARFGEFTQARALRRIRRAFGPRLFVGSPAQSRPMPATDKRNPDQRDRLNGAPLIYVHAKVSIFDDTSAIVSSANLNGRSFFWDTEAGVHLTQAPDVVHLRQRVMAHWLPDTAGPAAYDLTTAARTWAAIAARNARLHPSARDGFLLPHDFAAAEAFGHDLPFVPDEMV